ncbi:hypothetical protein GOODEAATRI_016785 [Goodea atripinnis]|uniref:Uncharacterized protein n=1 Tax=Goodea atripinnis TaxID=208336 RepID=A0ABV0NVA2_9TELE
MLTKLKCKITIYILNAGVICYTYCESVNIVYFVILHYAIAVMQSCVCVFVYFLVWSLFSLHFSHLFLVFPDPLVSSLIGSPAVLLCIYAFLFSLFPAGSLISSSYSRHCPLSCLRLVALCSGLV